MKTGPFDLLTERKDLFLNRSIFKNNEVLIANKILIILILIKGTEYTVKDTHNINFQGLSII